MLKKIEIEGLRGFGRKQELTFAKPNGEIGSGLSTLVGMNNSGKTTIIEAIKYFNCEGDSITFSQGKRNSKCDGAVYIKYLNFEDQSYILKTKNSGGSQVELVNNRFSIDNMNAPFILPSRRNVNYELNGGFYQSKRWDYVNSEMHNTKVRKPIIDNFQQRIFNWESNRKKFNQLLYRIIDRSLNWYIEQNDNGSYYLAFKNDEGSIHSSEGIGDGIWSVFTIIDALYDAKANSIIVIDEPELSLHPLYQKRILELLLEQSNNKQIIISTHSPYFISWDSLKNGGKIYRTFKYENDVHIKTLDKEDFDFIERSLKNYYNPHMWGIDAKELFFLEDNIIIVEGQEDVVAFNKICNEMNININASFFGWGAGGASNIEKILRILKNLGYKKICAIYDGDKREDCLFAEKKFPDFEFKTLWKDDIRDKEERVATHKEGVLDSKFKIKDGTEREVKEFLESLLVFFS